MKAIKIDVVKKSIYEVEVESGKNELQSIYKHLECDMIQIGAQYGGNCLYVDEEGLLRSYEKINGVFRITINHNHWWGTGCL